jgi:hypothetical protein
MANMTNVFILLPPHYALVSVNNPDLLYDTELCLYKGTISPAFVKSAEGPGVGSRTVYCFDFANQDPRCTFYVSDITKSNTNEDIVVPADNSGTCALVNITVGCNDFPPPTDIKQCKSASVSYVVSTRVNGEMRC